MCTSNSRFTHVAAPSPEQSNSFFPSTIGLLLSPIGDERVYGPPYIGGYIKANVAYLSVPRRQSGFYTPYITMSDERFAYCVKDYERRFVMIEKILQVMHGMEYVCPLHAMCFGSLCRPWHLVIYQHALIRYKAYSHKRDEDGNLPLHLFLKHCMVQQKYAIKTGYAKDNEDYSMAVSCCFDMILGSNLDAPKKQSHEKEYPLHIAIKKHLQIYIIENLVRCAPEVLHVHDAKSRLPPFVLAGVGRAANIDASFILLRKDPTVLKNLLQKTI